MFKRITTFIFILIFCISIFTEIGYSVELELESPSVILIEPESGKTLFEKNPHVERAPASVTKIMTLLIAIEAIKEGRADFEDIVVASENAWRLGGSQIYLEPGEEMSLKELLIAIAVGSANDACVAVAEHLYGTEGAFVDEMNKKVQKLGLKNTNFINTNGLPAEGHYTSAYDMAQIARECLRHEEILQLTSIKHYRLREDTKKPFQLDNTNKLLWWYKGTDGLKTGWIGEESGFCLAATAQKNGLRLISVVLGAPQTRGNFRDTMILFNHGFASYTFKEFMPPGQEIGQVKVEKGEKDYITAVTKTNVGLMVPKGKEKELTTEVKLLSSVKAPINKGDIIGEVTILRGNETVKKFDIIAKENVNKGSLWRQYKKVFIDIFNF